MTRIRLIASLFLLTLLPACSAWGVPYAWPVWQKGGTSFRNTTFYGTITIGDESIGVNYTTTTDIKPTEPVQLSLSPDYYTCSSCHARDTIYSPYTNEWNSNAPTLINNGESAVIMLNYKANHTITFSKPVVNPVLTVVSLNGDNEWVFNRDFTVLSYGTQTLANGTKKDKGHFGNGGTLERRVDVKNGITKTTLIATAEGHGTIGFGGVVKTITWSTTVTEWWSGVNVGILRIADPNAPITSCPTCERGTCNPNTARCECPNNYAGDRCERCAPGQSGPDCSVRVVAIDHISPTYVGDTSSATVITVNGANFVANNSYVCRLKSNTSDSSFMGSGVFVDATKIRCTFQPVEQGTKGEYIIGVSPNGVDYVEGQVSFQYRSACVTNVVCPRGRGICTAQGTCRCNNQYFGEDCSSSYVLPELKPHPNMIELMESTSYETTIELVERSEIKEYDVVTYRLAGNVPKGMTIGTYTGKLRWESALASSQNYTIDVIATNRIGSTHLYLTFRVKSLYVITSVSLNSDVMSQLLPTPRVITISGKIEWTSEATIQNPRVLIFILVPGGVNITQVVDVNNVTLTFSHSFTPSSRYAGRYDVGAIHPSIDTVPYTSPLWFRLAGIVTIPSISSLDILIPPNTPMDYGNLTRVKNNGDEPLTINATAYYEAAGLSIQILNAQGQVFPSAVTLTPGQSLIIGLRMNASQPWTGIVTSTFLATIGTHYEWLLNLRVRTMKPALSVSKIPIISVVTGTQQTIDLTVSNSGGVATGPLTLSIASHPAISVTRGSSLRSSLSPTSSFILSLLITANDTTPVGRYTGTLTLRDDMNQLGIDIPYTVQVLSSNFQSLRIVVEDEYTYFASGNPNVTNATIHLRNIQTGVDIRGTTDSTGSFIIPNLRADTYQLTVQADRHSSQNFAYQVVLGQDIFKVFLSRQAVSYVWTVTPTLFDDQYVFSLDATFETYVPMPVVVIEPAWLNLTEMELGKIPQIIFKITNYGLIRADDLEIGLPKNHPFLRFNWDTPIGNLEANTTIYVTVTVTRSNTNTRRLLQGGGGCYGGYFQYRVQCGGWKSNVQTLTLGHGGPCPSGPGIADGLDFCSGGGCSPAGTGGGGSYGGPAILSSSMGSQCDPDACKKAIIGCIISFSPLSCPNALFNGNPITGEVTTLGSIDAILSCYKVPVISTANDIAGCASALIPKCTPSFSAASTKKHIMMLPSHDSLTQLEHFVDILSHQHHAQRRLLDGDIKSAELAVMAQAIKLGHYVAIFKTVFKDPIWFDIPRSPALTAWNDAFREATLPTSDGGITLTMNEWSNLNVSIGPVTQIQTHTFLARYNRSMTYWSAGLYNLTDVQRFYGTAAPASTYDFIPRDQLLQQKDKHFADVRESQQQNFLDISQHFEAEKENYMYQANLPRAGICAKVTIRIVQEMIFTRSAFEAKLEISNQDTTPLENVTISISITRSEDTTHADTTSFFSIGRPSGNLYGNTTQTNPTTGGYVPIASSGSVSWLIIPLRQAAPITATHYKVGGILTYIQNGELVRVTLYPDDILVQPDPVLRIKYFHQKFVESQDPFTPEIITPPTPFVLGMLIQNSGYGTARDMSLTSSQPKIIDNQKGLLVKFEIIGADVNNKERENTLALTLGDIQPQTTSVVRWYLTSSLAGQFISYNASFTNTNPNGDSRVSVIDAFEYHEMLHTVKLDYPISENDGLSDFLTIEIPSGESYPSHVHTSKNGSMIYPVSNIRLEQTTTTIITSTDTSVLVTVKLTIPAGITLPSGTYFYARAINPRPTFRHTSAIRMSNAQYLDSDNTWTSHRTIHTTGIPDVQQDYIHLFDHTQTTLVGPNEWTYRMNISSVEQPRVNTSIPITSTGSVSTGISSSGVKSSTGTNTGPNTGSSSVRPSSSSSSSTGSIGTSSSGPTSAGPVNLSSFIQPSHLLLIFLACIVVFM